MGELWLPRRALFLGHRVFLARPPAFVSLTGVWCGDTDQRTTSLPTDRGQCLLQLCCERAAGGKAGGWFRLDIRRKYFAVRVVKHWHGSPGNVVDAPVLGNIPGQVCWGSEQPDQVRAGGLCINEAAACGRGSPGAPRPSPRDGVGPGPWHSKAGVSATLGMLQPVQGLLQHSYNKACICTREQRLLFLIFVPFFSPILIGCLESSWSGCSGGFHVSLAAVGLATLLMCWGRWKCLAWQSPPPCC